MADTARPHATEGLTPSACHDARTSTQAGCHDAPHIFADGDPHRAASSAGIAGPGRRKRAVLQRLRSGHGTWALVGSWSLTATPFSLRWSAESWPGCWTHPNKRSSDWNNNSAPGCIPSLPPQEPTQRQTAPGLSASRVRDAGRAMGHQDRRTAATSTLVETLIRKALRGIVVDRFIASCTERGLSLVAPQEFRNWLLAEGSASDSCPFGINSWWRYLILGACCFCSPRRA